jgi:hypothetical protein
MLAGLAALSLGVGTAMAQESAGGANASYENQQLLAMERAAASQVATGHVAPTFNFAPQYGSSDRTNVSNWPVPVLTGGDGSGG